MIYTMERHHELLHLWREQEATGLRVVHLDFHCDLRGMLIDRKEGRAYRTRDRFPALDQGNFLAHAIIEGRVESIRWVHDEPGGRADDIGTVKYESDLSAVPHRLALRARRVDGFPIEHDVVRSDQWEGLRAGECLDIDWDYFASAEYPVETIGERVGRFWDRAMGETPRDVYICYSPEYSHPSRPQFGEFVAELADRLDVGVVEYRSSEIPTPPNQRPARKYVPAPVYEGARRTYHRAARALKHRGIF